MKAVQIVKPNELEVIDKTKNKLWIKTLIKSLRGK